MMYAKQLKISNVRFVVDCKFQCLAKYIRFGGVKNKRKYSDFKYLNGIKHNLIEPHLIRFDIFQRISIKHRLQIKWNYVTHFKKC